MKSFYFICNRCHQIKVGYDSVVMTSGYYTMDGWAEYKQNLNETKVCEQCMWADPKYIRICGELKNDN